MTFDLVLAFTLENKISQKFHNFLKATFNSMFQSSQVELKLTHGAECGDISD